MTYSVRTESGLLTSTISNILAEDIINNVKGTFRPWTPTSSTGTKTVFEIAEGRVLTVSGDTKLYLWAKTLLIPD